MSDAFDWGALEALLFDLDGVLTPTAELHMKAWSEMFNAYLETIPGQAPYTDDDYFAYVDGKPRYDGVRDFLTSRGIELPFGTPDDAPVQETVCGLGNRKNDAFNYVLARDGIAPYPGSLRLLEAVDGKMKLAVVSSSKNARTVLDAAGLTHFFPVVVDGVVAAQQGLPGKPAPDTFLYAAAQLGVAPEFAVVLEDAISGVAAGAAGDFSTVIGVDRGVGAPALREAGAHLVVSDLGVLAGDAR